MYAVYSVQILGSTKLSKRKYFKRMNGHVILAAIIENTRFLPFRCIEPKKCWPDSREGVRGWGCGVVVGVGWGWGMWGVGGGGEF